MRCAWMVVAAMAVLGCDRNEGRPAATAATSAAGETSLPITFPRIAYVNTPKSIPAMVEKPAEGGWPVLMVRPGVALLSQGKPVSSSDSDPSLGKLSFITDGDKQGLESSLVEIGPGKQWVQIDLGKPAEIHAIAMWLDHHTALVYQGVVVQLADDADFIENARTVFNNDHGNQSGLGIGKDRVYLETNFGKQIRVDGQVARYVRVYTRGNLDNDMNHFTEIEVWGIPR